VLDVFAPAYRNQVWPLLQLVNVAQNRLLTMLSSIVQSIDLPIGVHGLTVLENETIKWLLNTWPEI